MRQINSTTSAHGFGIAFESVLKEKAGRGEICWFYSLASGPYRLEVNLMACDLNEPVPLDRPCKQAKRQLLVEQRLQDLKSAQKRMLRWLLKNGFLEPNSKKEPCLGVKKGAETPQEGYFWSTYPLHDAVRQMDSAMVSSLLRFGARPMTQDFWGRTAYDLAGRLPAGPQREEVLWAFRMRLASSSFKLRVYGRLETL